MIEYVATVHGTNANGAPVYRVVSDGLQVCYVTVPRKHSDAPSADATIQRALAALRVKPKPVR